MNIIQLTTTYCSVAEDYSVRDTDIPLESALSLLKSAKALHISPFYGVYTDYGPLELSGYIEVEILGTDSGCEHTYRSLVVARSDLEPLLSRACSGQ